MLTSSHVTPKLARKNGSLDFPAKSWRRRALRKTASAILTSINLRPFQLDRPIRLFSGGNQQKTLLARWLERDPRVLMLDEPTRGIDVGAKAEIHSVVDRLAAAGHGVLLISSDLHEVVGMSDRVLVMSRGRLVAECRGATQTERDVLQAAAGLATATPEADGC